MFAPLNPRVKMFLSFLLCILSIEGMAVESKIISSPIIAAYYNHQSQYWPVTGNRAPFSPKLIDPTILTDLYYAFAGFGVITKSIDPKNPRLTGNFVIQPLDKNDKSVLYPETMALKNRSKRLRVLLSIGGWSFNDPKDSEGLGQMTYRLFSQMVSSPANRKAFIDSAIAYSHQFGFDGIDIDWEYPGDLTRGGTPDDFNNFLMFLKECRQAFNTAKPPLLLSYTVPATVPFGVAKKYHDNPELFFKWVAKCSLHVDRIQVMCYDYHTPSDVPKITGVNAPLTRDTSSNSYLYIAKTLSNYLNNGLPANKLLLGMPTFGHSYESVSDLSAENPGPGKPFEKAGAPGPSTRTPGLLAYFEISDLVTNLQLTLRADPITSTSYGYHLFANKWVSFDTPSTLKLKSEMAKKQGLAGIFFWSIGMDEYNWEPRYPNIKSARSVFYSDSL